MRSISGGYWSLREALDWMCGFDPRVSVDQAFQALREFCRTGHVQAIGVADLDHPGAMQRIAMQLANGTELPRPPAMTENIPAEEWPNLYLHGDGQLYDSDTRLRVWHAVEVAKQDLPGRWLPIVKGLAKGDRLGSAFAHSTASDESGLQPILQNAPSASLAPVTDIGEAALGATKTHKRRGPAPGTLRRYEASYRVLFPDIDLLMKTEHISSSAAALKLANGEVPGKVVEGRGSAESRAKQLGTLYRKERGNRP
jgi:hypothetical protein